MKAWMLTMILMSLILAEQSHANSAHSAAATAQMNAGPVVAVDEKNAKPVRAGNIITVGAEPQVLVGKHNIRYELSPHAVAEFSQLGIFTLLRGSAIAESRSESSMKTNSANIDFLGRVVVSYDYKEKSTSAFVLSGEARMVNPGLADRTLRLDRFRGATMVVGEIYPQLIRNLDFAAVEAWLQGYSWPKERLNELLAQLPNEKLKVAENIPDHLQTAKLEDYFSSIDSVNDEAPDYYERKFSDPDTQVLQANNKKEKKEITPEVAAMITLPNTKIDLDFDLPPQLLTEKEKRAELRNAKIYDNAKKGRGLASLPSGDQKKQEIKKPATEHGDPQINAVLERLRSVRKDAPAESGVVSGGARPSNRAPASVIMAVPDPVYDYSENF